jgi:hypothetical protein
MYTKDKNGSRRHQFVSEETRKAELQEGAPIRGIKISTIDGSERGSSCNNAETNLRSAQYWRVISLDNHRFPVRKCDDDSAEQSIGFLQYTTTSTNLSSVTADTRAIPAFLKLFSSGDYFY